MAIVRDYKPFVAQVELFRDELRSGLPDVTVAFAYADVYVAEAWFDLGVPSYHTPRRPPIYASYDDYPEDEDFDYNTALAGYGTWIFVDGMRVWRPPVLPVPWRPFVHGYWTSTRLGWYWVGYEPFAWVVYHYGYWIWDPDYGWCWVPDVWDYAFVPANCWWYFGSDFWWWYPAPPPRHRCPPRMKIVAPDPRRGVVVKKEDFLAPDLSKVVRSPASVEKELRAHGKAEFAALPGPPVRQVELATGKTVREEPVRTTERPTKAKGRKIMLVRPEAARTPPKIFRDLDGRTKRDILAPPARKPAPLPRAPAPPAARPPGSKAPATPRSAPPPAPPPRVSPEKPRPTRAATPDASPAPAKGSSVAPAPRPAGRNAPKYTAPTGRVDEDGAIADPTPTAAEDMG